MPYGQLNVYAFIPAELYYLALFIQVDLNAKKNGILGIPRAELPRFWPTAKQGYLFLIPLAVLLTCMIVLTYSAEKSAIYAIISLILISWLSHKKEQRIGFGRLVNGAEGAMKGLISVAVACAGCGIIIGALSLSLLSYKLTFQLMSMVGGTLLPVLCLAAIICYIMGMGVSPLVSYLTLALMVAPAVIKMGVPPLAIHLFIMYWAITAFITPPFAVAAFVAAGIAKCSLWGAGFQAMRLGIGTYLVPFIFVYHPGLLLLDSPPAIVMAVVTAIVGISCLSIGVEGHLFKDLNWPQRLLFMAGGIALSLFSGFEQLYGLIAVLVALAWHWISTRTTKSSASV
jgi:TRAP transporter 4TM/12TM fusion protein